MSRNIVLTAAHCVTGKVSNQMRLILSPDDLEVINEFSFFNSAISVERILVPDGYLKSRQALVDGDDIALIQLKKDLPERYQPVRIATDEESALKQNLFSAGFGAWTPELSEPDENTSGALSVAKIATPTYSPNQRALKFSSRRSDPVLCKGDSGGPVYFEKGGVIHVIGVNVAIDFHKDSDAKKFRCANENADQVASAVWAENYRFIADGFMQLSGRPLDN